MIFMKLAAPIFVAPRRRAGVSFELPPIFVSPPSSFVRRPPPVCHRIQDSDPKSRHTVLPAVCRIPARPSPTSTGARGGLGARWLEDAWTAASLWSVSILVGLASCGRGDRVASCPCSPRSPAQLPAELFHLLQLPGLPIRGSRSSDFRLSGSCGRYAIGCLERVGERCLRGPTGRSNALVMSRERPGSVILDYRIRMLIMPYAFVLHSIGGLIPGK